MYMEYHNILDSVDYAIIKNLCIVRFDDGRFMVGLLDTIDDKARGEDHPSFSPLRKKSAA